MSSLRDDIAMSVEEFLAFTDTRPDEERWELIDGEPILNPSPSYGHQKVVKNLLSLLIVAEERGVDWEVLPGLGVKLSNQSMPVPDVLIRPAIGISGHFCDDMIVAFEILSPSSRSRDLRWKKHGYSGLASLQHCVVLAQDASDMRCYNRADGWQEQRVSGPEGRISLAAIGVDLVAKAVYRGTGLV